MTIKIKKLKSSKILTQKQIIRKFNRGTRQSYRYFEQLLWEGGVNGSAV